MNLQDLNSLVQAVYRRPGVVTPLVLICALLLAALVFVMPFSPPEWLLAGLFALLCLFLALFGSVYLYFMRKQPDKLHSEEYLMQRMNMVIVGRSQPEKIVDAESMAANPLSGSAASSADEGDPR